MEVQLAYHVKYSLTCQDWKPLEDEIRHVIEENIKHSKKSAIVEGVKIHFYSGYKPENINSNSCSFYVYFKVPSDIIYDNNSNNVLNSIKNLESKAFFVKKPHINLSNGEHLTIDKISLNNISYPSKYDPDNIVVFECDNIHPINNISF